MRDHTRHNTRRHAATRWPTVLLAAGLTMLAATTAKPQDVSPAPILQWFEASYDTIHHRAPDLFKAGYGAVWTPPPGRADISNFSVGYDVYDRFDLGSWDNKTLYGTETGIKRVADIIHRTGNDFHVDFVMNHNGYSGTGDDGSRQAFIDAGGYPGFFSEFFGDVDGDFHGAFQQTDAFDERLAGLIDIDHAKNYQAIRSPVPGFNNNIAAGTTPWSGRLANVALESNRALYPDIGHETIFVYDPVTGEQNIPVHSFNLDNPMAGDPTEENALGYLMRNAQWLVQVIGVDGLRLDAGKHIDEFGLDFLDRAVYRANRRNLLDGSPKHVFSYSEVFDGNPAVLGPHVKKTIDPNDPGRIGGNRDTLDFKWYFAVKDNLEQYGQGGAWYNVKDAGLDVALSGLHNGLAGVKFVSNHDVYKPYKLENVANALGLMLPGNFVMYFNGKEFGDNRDFPRDGRGDALSVGGAGSLTTRLVGIRESHGRGNYAERWVDNEGIYIFERVSSAVVGLSNRGDGGFDQRTVEVGFAPGTHLLELTGNAEDSFVDPYNDIPEVVTVFQGGDGKSYANIRVPRNLNANGDEHQRGYVIYGLATPQSANGLEILGNDGVLAGDTNINNNYENGTKRQSDVYIVKGDSFTARLQTNEVRLLGSDDLRDIWADGDFAVIKLDGGRDLNGNGYVDFVTPNSVTYGFENFGTKNSPLINGNLGNPRGDGEFLQDIDTTNLEEGYHFIEVRAFRHRTDGGPPVFTSWKESIYVDRLDPESAIAEYRAVNDPSFGDRDVMIESVDFTADNVHVFLNLAADVSEQDVLNMVGSGSQADRVDINLFKKYFGGMARGNNVLTVVTYEPTGTTNVQRFTGQWIDGRGGGLGDLNHDGFRNVEDVAGQGFSFEAVLYSDDTAFNPAADINGDGRVGWLDLLGLRDELANNGAQQDTLDEYDAMLLRRGNINGEFGTDQWDIDEAFARFGTDDWLADIDGSGSVDQADIDALVGTILGTSYGDANLDGAVDFSDFLALQSAFGGTTGWAGGDFTGDGVVNFSDFLILQSNFGALGAAEAQAVAAFAAEAVVPEPGSLALLGVGGFLLLHRRGHRKP